MTQLDLQQEELNRRIAACVNAFEGIPTERIEGKDLGQILAGEMRLHGAGPRNDGGFGFEFSGGVCQLMAEAYAGQFKESGAINYLELLFDHTEIGPLTITMQRVQGLTPAQKLAQAEAERDALQQSLNRYSMSAGQADQRMAESRAVRHALGFGEDADDVSPSDLVGVIRDIQQQVNALAAEGCEFFAYSSEHGYETYSTAAEARKAAEDMIPDFLVDGWDEEVNTVSWGQVVGSAVMVNKHPAPKGSEFDFICDYVIKDSKLADLRQHVE